MNRDPEIGAEVRCRIPCGGMVPSTYVAHGYALGCVNWNPRGEGCAGPAVRCCVVRYAWDPRGDAPRRAFTIADLADVELAPVPEGYVVSEHLR